LRHPDHAEERVAEHLAVSLWTALEVFVESVFVEMCKVSDLTNERLRSVKVSIVDYSKLSEDERFGLIWNQLGAEGGSGVDGFDRVLGHVGVSVDVSALAPWKTPTSRGASIDNAWVRAGKSSR